MEIRSVGEIVLVLKSTRLTGSTRFKSPIRVEKFEDLFYSIIDIKNVTFDSSYVATRVENAPFLLYRKLGSC